MKIKKKNIQNKSSHKNKNKHKTCKNLQQHNFYASSQQKVMFPTIKQYFQFCKYS